MLRTPIRRGVLRDSQGLLGAGSDAAVASARDAVVFAEIERRGKLEILPPLQNLRADGRDGRMTVKTIDSIKYRSRAKMEVRVLEIPSNFPAAKKIPPPPPPRNFSPPCSCA